MPNPLSVQTVNEAAERLAGVVKKTPLQFCPRLSEQYGAKIYLKREDLQEVRSYKIRGAYNLVRSLTPAERGSGVVCASAGNHAQGVAMSCARLKVRGTIFMPTVTPLQKISRVRYFGGDWIDIRLIGTTFDEASAAAKAFAKKHKAVFVHPFDDWRVMSGQGTVGKEIADELGAALDVVVVPVGGGGLLAGLGTYLKAVNSHVSLVAAEPQGAAGFAESLKRGRVVTLKALDTFVDGAAVRTVGRNTFAVVRRLVDRSILVPEGAVCSAMIDLYQNEGIVAEPAGALAVAALEKLGRNLRGKTVVCVLSGGNNDILRYPEIMERSLIFKGLKHYFLVQFAQKPGQLKRLLTEALGPTDDIVRFEYVKKNSRETGPALIGIEIARKQDLGRLTQRLRHLGIRYRKLESGDLLASYLV
ncbi:MAG: threonine ammonia-lyase IlvA [Patescibacteria group bacterium]|nr:threonine ammonia-lyase IlvA [Patescibacteria group bacterium]